MRKLTKNHQSLVLFCFCWFPQFTPISNCDQAALLAGL